MWSIHGLWRKCHDCQLTLKWLSCDMLTPIRDTAKRAPVLSLFSFSLIPVIHLQTVNTLLNSCQESVNESQMDLKTGDVEYHQQTCGDCTCFEKWLQTGWMYIIKTIGPKTLEEPHSEASFVKRCSHLLLQPGLYHCIRQVGWKPLKGLARYVEHVMQPCNENARRIQPIECSWQMRSKTDTQPASALPRRQFMTSRRAVSILWCAQ